MYSLTTEEVGFHFLWIFTLRFINWDKLQRKHMDSVSEGSRVLKLKSVLITLSHTHTHACTFGGRDQYRGNSRGQQRRGYWRRKLWWYVSRANGEISSWDKQQLPRWNNNPAQHRRCLSPLTFQAGFTWSNWWRDWSKTCSEDQQNQRTCGGFHQNRSQRHSVQQHSRATSSGCKMCLVRCILWLMRKSLWPKPLASKYMHGEVAETDVFTYLWAFSLTESHYI